MQEMFRSGILILSTHNVTLAHNKKVQRVIISKYEKVLTLMKKAVSEGNLRDKLEVIPLKPLFKVRQEQKAINDWAALRENFLSGSVKAPSFYKSEISYKQQLVCPITELGARVLILYKCHSLKSWQRLNIRNIQTFYDFSRT